MYVIMFTLVPDYELKNISNFKSACLFREVYPLCHITVNASVHLRILL